MRAPAKLNLVLEVTDRRPDGYHEIDSIFVAVSLWDDLTVRIGEGPPGSVQVDARGFSVPEGRENTVWRAVEEFYRGARERPAVTVSIAKRIPPGGGLGGGSSDAAAVLRGLARFEGLGLDAARVRRAAERVGADVPFFLWGRPARVRGTGEKVEVVPDPGLEWFVLVWPGFSVDTKWAYGELDRALTWPRPAGRVSRFQSGARREEDFHNDFETIVGGRYPEIAVVKRRLRDLGARAASLTGSGSALFGWFPNRSAAREASERLREDGWWSVVVRRLHGVPEAEDNLPGRSAPGWAVAKR